jgi:hypothetical protein
MKSTIKIIVSLVVLLFTGVNKVQSIGPVNISDVAWPNISDSGISLPGNPYYWWVYTDENTNYAQLSSWTDRIQGFQFTQSTNTYKPYNTPEGVYLTIDRHFNNTTLPGWTNWTFCFIMNPRARNTAFGQVWGWLPGAGRGFALGSTTNLIASPNGISSDLSPTLLITNLYDFVVTSQSYSGGSGSTNQVISSYTDGVIYTNYLQGAFSWLMLLDRLGDDQHTAHDAGTEYIREIIVWTNALSSAEAVQVHQYRTNTYGSAYSSLPASLATDLVAHWSLDETTGTRVDCINGNNLAETNTVGGTVGVVNGAALLVRANSEWLFTPDSASLSMGDIDFTATVWFNFSSVGNADIIGKWDSASNNCEYLLRVDNGTQRFIFEVSGNGTTSTTVSSSGTWSLNTTYFIRVWHDATNNQIGMKVNEGTAVTSAHATGCFSGTAPLGIGSRFPTASQYFNGWIDLPTIWKRLLTDDEGRMVYNFGWGRPLCP